MNYFAIMSSMPTLMTFYLTLLLKLTNQINPVRLVEFGNFRFQSFVMIIKTIYLHKGLITYDYFSFWCSNKVTRQIIFKKPMELLIKLINRSLNIFVLVYLSNLDYKTKISY